MLNIPTYDVSDLFKKSTENFPISFLTSYLVNIAPFDKKVSIGTFRLVCKAQESAAKERAIFPSVVEDPQVSNLTLRTPLNFLIRWLRSDQLCKLNVWAGHHSKVIAEACLSTKICSDSESRSSDCSGWCFYKDVNLSPHRWHSYGECCSALFWGCSNSSGWFVKLSFSSFTAHISSICTNTYNSLKIL